MYSNIKIEKSIFKQLDLSGKNAVISGGAGFLGIQFAETIIELGGNPIIFDNNNNAILNAIEKLKNLKNDITGYEVDITSDENCRDIVNLVTKKYGHIDILINSAALTKNGIENESEDFFNDFEKINLTGTQIMCKLVGPLMASSGGGSIVNIASEVGVISPDQRIYKPDTSVNYKGVDFNCPAFYAVSKAGVIHLTKYLSTIWAKDNVRVNSISPGGVYRDHEKDFVEKLSSRIPLGRMALANEFKGAIAFLSSRASSYVTGHNLVVDGGRSIW